MISFILLTGLLFLVVISIGILMVMAVFTFYYVFIKRVRLYCKAKKEFKKVLQEYSTALENRTKQDNRMKQ